MSGFRGRGRGRGRGGGGSGPPKGLFVNGVWHCDCSPRLPAVHFEVKKDGPNKGRWFRSCQKQMNDEGRCKFFLWDNDAHPREAAALSNNSRTEPGHAEPVTPSKRQPSPPPPYSIDLTSSGPNRKRRRSASGLEDDYGLGPTENAFNDELNQVMTEVETPSKAMKTSEFATPSTRRKLPWQQDEASDLNRTGLQTPQSVGKNDPFNTRLVSASGSKSTPSRPDRMSDDMHEVGTPSSSVETPTPNRFRNVATEDLVRDVFHLLQVGDARLSSETEANLKHILSTHAKNAEGYKRGRDVLRTTIKAKEAKITELTYRVSTLEAELEAEKAMVKHLQWEVGS